MPGSVESQVAVNTAKIQALETETERLRERVHALESSIRGVELLTGRLVELEEDLPRLARQVAREVVAEARRARHADVFSNLRTYAVIVSATVAVTTLVVLVILRP